MSSLRQHRHSEAVRDGDVIVINGGRAAQLCEIGRRVFGVTDGFISGVL